MAFTNLVLPVIQPFDFPSLLQAHGWVDLLPNEYQREANTFTRIEELPSGKVIKLVVSANDKSIEIKIQHASSFPPPINVKSKYAFGISAAGTRI